MEQMGWVLTAGPSRLVGGARSYIWWMNYQIGNCNYESVDLISLATAYKTRNGHSCLRGLFRFLCTFLW